MEAALPFSSFERQKNFSPAVEITVPLRILRVLEFGPEVVIQLFKPFSICKLKGFFCIKIKS